jgi:hypothetical protein
MRRLALVLVALLLLVPAVGTTAQSRQTAIEVYKSPTCGCCSQWVEHLKRHGFTVRTTDTESIDELKASRGVPPRARSCHTALVGGYVVEGHVPAAEVRRLLKERPAVAGIAVAGMPLGSPGMEVEGRKPQTYNVISFDKQGATKVFSTQNGAK